jgi:hypothetical protein
MMSDSNRATACLATWSFQVHPIFLVHQRGEMLIEASL